MQTVHCNSRVADYMIGSLEVLFGEVESVRSYPLILAVNEIGCPEEERHATNKDKTCSATTNNLKIRTYRL